MCFYYDAFYDLRLKKTVMRQEFEGELARMESSETYFSKSACGFSTPPSRRTYSSQLIPQFILKFSLQIIWEPSKFPLSAQKDGGSVLYRADH